MCVDGTIKMNMSFCGVTIRVGTYTRRTLDIQGTTSVYAWNHIENGGVMCETVYKVFEPPLQTEWM